MPIPEPTATTEAVPHVPINLNPGPVPIWVTFNGENSGLGGNVVHAATTGANNNKWFAVYRADPNNNFNAPWQGLTGLGVAVLDDKDTIATQDDQWTRYTTANSPLISNTVRDMMTDDHGNIWFVTPEGVSRYDGAGWTSYTTENSGMTSNNVKTITQSPDGSIWLGTDVGAFRFDGSDTWDSYNSSNSGLATDSVTAIAGDALGHIWFSTSGQVLSILDDAGTSTKLDDTWDYEDYTQGLVQIDTPERQWRECFLAYKISADPTGRLWFLCGASMGGVAAYDSGIWSSWQPPIGIIVSGVTGHARDFTTAVDFDTAGTAWVAGAGSVSGFDGTRWTDYTHELTGGQLPLAAFWSITVDKNGVVWIGGAAGVTALYPGR